MTDRLTAWPDHRAYEIVETNKPCNEASFVYQTPALSFAQWGDCADRGERADLPAGAPLLTTPFAALTDRVPFARKACKNAVRGD